MYHTIGVNHQGPARAGLFNFLFSKLKFDDRRTHNAYTLGVTGSNLMLKIDEFIFIIKRLPAYFKL